MTCLKGSAKFGIRSTCYYFDADVVRLKKVEFLTPPMLCATLQWTHAFNSIYSLLYFFPLPIQAWSPLQHTKKFYLHFICSTFFVFHSWSFPISLFFFNHWIMGFFILHLTIFLSLDWLISISKLLLCLPCKLTFMNDKCFIQDMQNLQRIDIVDMVEGLYRLKMFPLSLNKECNSSSTINSVFSSISTLFNSVFEGGY